MIDRLLMTVSLTPAVDRVMNSYIDHEIFDHYQICLVECESIHIDQ